MIFWLKLSKRVAHGGNYSEKEFYSYKYTFTE